MQLAGPSNLTSDVAHADVSHLDFLVVQALGVLPAGTKVLFGEDGGYVIAPLGHIIDERYTAYFNFIKK